MNLLASILASRAGGFHPTYQAVLDQANTSGYALPTGDQQVKQNRLVVELDSIGALGEKDLLFVFANNAANINFGRLNWINPLIACGDIGAAPGFTANQGIFGGAGVGQFTTNWVPSTDAIKYTLNSASFGVWVHTGFVETINAQTVFGVAQGSNNILLTDDGAVGIKGRINGAATDTNFTGADNYTDQTFYSMVRTGASAIEAFVNGASVATGTTASNALPSLAPYILARNSGGAVNTPISSTTGRFAIVYTGSGNIDQAQLYTAFSNYMSSI